MEKPKPRLPWLSKFLTLWSIRVAFLAVYWIACAPRFYERSIQYGVKISCSSAL